METRDHVASLADDVGAAEDDQRDHQHGAGDDLLLLGRHAGKAQRVLHEGQHEQRDQHAAPACRCRRRC